MRLLGTWMVCWEVGVASPFALAVTSLTNAALSFQTTCGVGRPLVLSHRELRWLMWSFVFIPGKQCWGFGWMWSSDSCFQLCVVLLYQNLPL